MMKSRFDDLTKTLKSPSDCGGTLDNPVAVAAKILSINQTIRQVNQERENWKAAIIENLRICEKAVATLARLVGEREKIAISSGKLNDYANDARARMAEIREAGDAIIALLDTMDDDTSSDDEYRQRLSDAIHRINNERDAVLADIGTVGQSVESLEAEFRNLTTCIKQQKAANAALRATLRQKRKDVVSRNRKSLARYEELVKQKDRMERDDIKVEKGADF